MSEELIAAITRPAHRLRRARDRRRRPTQREPGADRRPAATSRHRRCNDIILRAGYRALLVVPLLGPDEVVGALVVRRKAPGEFPKQHGRSAADLRRAVGAGDPERAPVRRDRGEEPPARAREPAQVAVPRQHEPRAAHAAQRHHRPHRDDGHQRAALRHREGGRAAAPRASRRHAPARPDQPGARPVEDRGRQARAQPRDRERCAADRRGRRHRAPARRAEQEPARRRVPDESRRRSRPTRCGCGRSCSIC